MTIDISDIILDHHGTEQLHAQLSSYLRTYIMSHPQARGAQLPPAYRLASVLRINRATVTKAYRKLEEDHIIERQSPRRFCYSTMKFPRMSSPYPTVGIILPSRFSKTRKYDNGMCMEYFEGIIDAATDAHLSTIMLNMPDFSASAEEIRAFNKDLEDRLIGVVHLGDRNRRNDRPLSAVLHNENVPQVIVSATPKLPHVGGVHDNPSVGAHKLAERLVAFGHREVGILLYFNGFEDLSDNRFFTYGSHCRGKIFRDVFRKHGLVCDDACICYNCNSYLACYEALGRLAYKNHLPTCLWCHNDQIAFHAIRALNKLGLSVPQDISVVGYDGINIRNIPVALTTVGLPFYEIGRQAVLQLLKYNREGINDSNRCECLPTYLVLGRTLTYARHSS